MSDQLHVVGDTLGSLTTSLTTASRLLDNSVSGVSGHEDDIGHDGVAQAASRFERHWGDGRTRLREQVEMMSQVITDSLASFDEAEAEIAAALDNPERASVATHGPVAV